MAKWSTDEMIHGGYEQPKVLKAKFGRTDPHVIEQSSGAIRAAADNQERYSIL